MKKLLLSFLLVFSWQMIIAQVLTNNGSITIVGTGKLIVEGGMTSGAGSSLTVQSGGNLTVSGNLTFVSGATVDQNGLVKFDGNDDANLTSNGVDLGNVEIAKTGEANVLLVDDMSMDGALTLTSGDLVLGTNDLLMANTATSSIGTASSHVNASSTGRMQKGFAGSSSFTFAVGDGTNYSPLASTPSGASTVRVGVDPSAAANTAAHPNKLNRHWLVNSSGNVTNALVGTYNDPADIFLGSDESKIVGGVWNGTSWTFNTSSGNAGGNQVLATAPESASEQIFTGLTTIGTVKLRVFLAGAYNSGTGLMNSTLNDLGILDLITTSPYGDGSTAPSIPNADVVDWVFLEITNPNPSSSGDPTITKSAFIKKNGDIVDLDGISDPQIIGAYNPAWVRVKHRNHLSIRTNSGIDTQVPILQDFSSNLNVYDISNGNPAQRNISGNIWGLWPGDITGDNRVRYTNGGTPFAPIPSDAASILTALSGNTAGQLNDYNKHDLNLDGKTRYTNGGTPFAPIPSDAAIILTMLNGITSAQLNQD